MSVYSWNAEAFASRPEPAIDQQRHAGVRETVELLLDGNRRQAHIRLAASVERQVRMAGLGNHRLIDTELPCGCGVPACRGTR